MHSVKTAMNSMNGMVQKPVNVTSTDSMKNDKVAPVKPSVKSESSLPLPAVVGSVDLGKVEEVKRMLLMKQNVKSSSKTCDSKNTAKSENPHCLPSYAA